MKFRYEAKTRGGESARGEIEAADERGAASQLREKGLPVASGVFGAYMEIEMTAWGPVTILMDSDDRARPRHGNGG